MKRLNKNEMMILSKKCGIVLNGINPLNNKIIARVPDKKPVEIFNCFQEKYKNVDYFIIGYTDKTGANKAEKACYIALPTKYIDYNIFSCMFVNVERKDNNNNYICNDLSFKNRKYFTNLIDNLFINKLTTISVNEFIGINSNKGVSFEIYLDDLLKGNNANIHSTELYDIELKGKKYQIKIGYEGNNSSEILSYNKNNLSDIDTISSRLYR